MRARNARPRARVRPAALVRQKGQSGAVQGGFLSRSVLVLVPTDGGVTALSAVPGIEPLRYDPDAPLPAAAREAEVLVVAASTVQRQLDAMRELPKLRLVQTISAGTDQWHGRLPAGVALSNARGAHGGSTAEWAVGALLALYREIPRFLSDATAGRWEPHQTGTLAGRRVLVLGAGDLGTALRRRLEPFETEVTMVARRPRPDVHTLDEVPGLLPDHDAVVVMLPLADELRGLVDAAFLARMPDGAILVNAARGAHVVTSALLAELESGRLRAALDVTDPEPLPPDHPLWRAPGLLLTPHVGGLTTGVSQRIWSVIARQLDQYVRDGRPENLVG
ncbi:phosphoglycerate dehydrogenase-like oxidoreductase [Frankia torreyi]|uniref:Phosphoglycerate dehydrogenase-like oxidoreductase n=1 Tax=Frankia torreyi TaxID=1856 RepID=A0A0D8BN19_9ACTN|nr:phosphoglycerate dehydrogenase-like oxidoreductase [Frankia torreyi]KQM06180.1 phosphoglycerate dehydrogenase-like oxidoreductase [Frankia sp. CpI1-P]